MKDSISLIILFGGVSSEHKVSCISAASVLEHISRDKYDVKTIGIDMEGNWFLTEAPADGIADGTWEQHPGNRRAFITPDRSIKGIAAECQDGTFEIIKTDVVFPVMHGKNGEDGTMQGLLQLAGIPFVGCGTASSAASMDKAMTKAIISHDSDVEQAKCYVMNRINFEKDPIGETERMLDRLGGTFPLFIKPANAGSSVGISKAKEKDDLDEAFAKAFAEDSKILIEEMVTGREIEVAVLGNSEPVASCIGEIFAANEFYDYDAKYENKSSKTAIVRDLTPEKEQEIRDEAVTVYRTMGCRGMSRIDFFLEESGRIVFNELNTLPGFTSISMYPQLWEASGLPYGQLIDKLIMLALEK